MSAEQLVTWIVGAVVGVLEVPIFEYVKSKLGVDGKTALLLVMLFSIALGFLALLATGGFSPFDVNRLFEYVGAIVVLGQLTYGLFKK